MGNGIALLGLGGKSQTIPIKAKGPRKVRDPEGFRDYCTRTQILGYDGKWALHPDQVTILNEVGSLAAVAQVISEFIPPNGRLFTTEDQMLPILKEMAKSKNTSIRAINERESLEIATAFLSPPFLMGQYRFLRSKKKYGPAAMFLALRVTHPAWSRLI